MGNSALTTLDNLFKLLIRFFAILGFLCFLEWVYLLITGEYTSMLKELGIFTGRAVTTIAACVILGKGMIIYFRGRRAHEDEGAKPPVPTIAAPVSDEQIKDEEDAIYQFEKYLHTYSYDTIDEYHRQIKTTYPEYDVLQGKIRNAKRPWERAWKKGLEWRSDKTKAENQKMFSKSIKPTPTPIELKTA